MKGRYGPVEKAITMISLEISKNSILKIYDPKKISNDQFNQIKKQILKPVFGPDGYNIKKTGQAEYNFALKTMYSAYDNSTAFEKIKYAHSSTGIAKNELAKFYNDLIMLSNLHPNVFQLTIEN